MPTVFFPLRWESTGEQWWYATPIDFAAANGLYDVVRELLHFDTNLLIKLTSLRRIRRLETLWDDDESQFQHVAKSRSYVAKKLLLEGESKGGKNSLIRAGYGGWLLYTAASAGDVDFVMELLEKDPLLVFGEGEYGVTDILYGAARSKNCEVFKLLLDFALSLRCWPNGEGASIMEEEELNEMEMEMPLAFRWEMINRAIHCCARGGNLVMMRELIGDCCPDVLIYRDAQGSTILHTAAGRGQIEVVKNLVASFDIISNTDGQGNTSLHLAAYRAHLAVVEFLIHECPSLISLLNYYGETFLHLAVAGFKTPGFRRLDRQIELMERLVRGELMNVREIINIRNNDGKTALHVAVTGHVECGLVELLMSVPSINLNFTDDDGLTPLDLLEQQRPRSPSLEILIKRFVSAGGISNRRDYMATNAFFPHLKMQGIGNSPGTSFRIPDAEIFLYTGIENVSDATRDQVDEDFDLGSDDNGECDSVDSSDKKSISVNHTVKRLKFFLRWPKSKEKKPTRTDWIDDDYSGLFDMSKTSQSNQVSLRHQYSNISSLSHNRTTFPSMNIPPSPSTKKRFAVGLMHGVIQATPKLAVPPGLPLSPFSGSPMSSPMSSEDYSKTTGIGGVSCSNRKVPITKFRQDSFNRKMLMNQYFCFGAQGLAEAEDPTSCKKASQNNKYLGSLVA